MAALLWVVGACCLVAVVVARGHRVAEVEVRAAPSAGATGVYPTPAPATTGSLGSRFPRTLNTDPPIQHHMYDITPIRPIWAFVVAHQMVTRY